MNDRMTSGSSHWTRSLLSRFTLIDFIDVGGAGHMVAGDRNDVCAGAVADFLDSHAEDQ
ncbi:pimeloyl-ACP methyl ester carboxylesterase [Mycobacterium sp. URHB0021]